MIAGVLWRRIVGPIVGLALFFLMFRFGGGVRGLILGLCAFLLACWLGERHWWQQVDTDERRSALEDRRRHPSE